MGKKPSESYQQKVAALAFIEPTRDRLAEWVPASATILARARLGSHHAGDARRAALELLTLVEYERAALNERLANEPIEIRQHSRVADAQRALDAISTVLGDAIDLLDG